VCCVCVCVCVVCVCVCCVCVCVCVCVCGVCVGVVCVCVCVVCVCVPLFNFRPSGPILTKLDTNIMSLEDRPVSHLLIPHGQH